MFWQNVLHEPVMTKGSVIQYFMSRSVSSDLSLEADRISFSFPFSVPEKPGYLFFGRKRCLLFRFFSFSVQKLP